MPRLTPEELRERKIKAQKERERVIAETEAERIRFRKAEERKQAELIEQKEQARFIKARYSQLVSVTEALYDEMDKLNKKGPVVPVSDLTLERINKIIRAAKEIVKADADEFMDDINPFVAAGDPPQYRDVTLILGQVKAGLSRFEAKRERQWMTLGV